MEALFSFKNLTQESECVLKFNDNLTSNKEQKDEEIFDFDVCIFSVWM